MELSYAPSLRVSTLRPYKDASSNGRQIKFMVPEKFQLTSASYKFLPFAKPYSPQMSRTILAPRSSNGPKPIPIQTHAQLEADESSFALEAENFQKISSLTNVLWNFMRPFVVTASVVQFTLILARTWMENSHLLRWSNGSLLINAVAGLLSILCSNAFTSGLNQIFDVEIDKINKPHLPIVAGDLPIQSAWVLVTIYVAIGMAAAATTNSPLFLAFICFQFFLGAIYSIPPFRLKESTAGAILICAVIQGCAYVLCMSTGARATLGLPFKLSPPVAFLATFASLFSFTMGFIKDITDVEGDKKFGSRTLATIFGVRNVVFFGCGLFLANYLGAILTAIYMPQAFRRSIMIPAHALMALSLIYQVWKLDKANYPKEESWTFYMFCWRLFYFEYLLFPFI